MADSVQKKESIKKNALRQKEKAQKREERKLNNNKGKGLDSMIAPVEPDGTLTAAPPERMLIQKAAVN
jgi:cold shock protein